MGPSLNNTRSLLQTGFRSQIKNRTANSADPDKTACFSSGSTLFDKVYVLVCRVKSMEIRMLKKPTYTLVFKFTVINQILYRENKTQLSF